MRWLLALCLVVSGVCEARPFTVDDLVGLESYGQVMVARRQALLLVERRRAYNTADDYGFGPLTPRLLSRIMVAALTGTSQLSPLFDQDAGAGYWMGSLSPDGRRLSVFRLRGRSLTLGVVDLSNRQIRWLAVAPDLPLAAPAPIWLDNHHLLVVTMPKGDLPPILTLESGVSRDLRRLWIRAGEGKSASATIANSMKPGIPDDAARTLVNVNVDDGRATVLLRDNIVDAALSPDGTHLAVVSANTYRRPGAGTIDTSFIARHHQLVIFNARSGAEMAKADNILPGFLRWSRRGERILAFSPGDDLRSGHFVVLGAHTPIALLARQHQPWVVSDQSAVMVQATWQGAAVIARMDVGGRPRWMRGGTWAPLPGIPGDAELVGADGEHSWFRAGNRLLRLDRRMNIADVARDVSQIGISSLDPSSIGYRELMNPSTRPGGWVIRDVHGATVVDDRGTPLGKVADDSNVLAITRHIAVTFDVDEYGVGQLVVHTRNGDTIIDRNNLSLRDLTLPRLRRLDVDGQHHWLVLPARPAHPALVVVPYPGQLYGADLPPGLNPALPAIPTNVHLLTSAGFAVLLPSLPAMRPGAPSAPLVDAVARAVDTAASTGMIDAGRVAVLGHSFGAYAALVLATHSSRFRAVIASSGPYDLATAHASMAGPDRIRLDRGLPFASSAGWAEGGQARMLVPPLAPATRYVAASPMFAANRSHVPILLVHGDLDTVGIDQAEHMFMELARQRADATLVRYWGEGHVLSSPANIRDYWSRVIAFLRDHLGVSPSKPAPTPRS